MLAALKMMTDVNKMNFPHMPPAGFHYFPAVTIP